VFYPECRQIEAGRASNIQGLSAAGQFDERPFESSGGINLRPAISIRTRLRRGVEEGALYPLPLGRTGDTSTLSEYAIMAEICRHLNQVRRVHPSGNGCRECLETGDAWVHLRLCLTCGHVGCCDDSKNRHATKHFHATHHPIIQSFEPGEDWRWCYVDEMMV
jgi:Zn-finger in ubiquitin-hydrolases and other protein